jgi:hypothetical protein
MHAIHDSPEAFQKGRDMPYALCTLLPLPLKRKADISLSINIGMSIKVNLDLGEVSNLSQILNLKLPSVALLWRKEVEEVR